MDDIVIRRGNFIGHFEMCSTWCYFRDKAKIDPKFDQIVLAVWDVRLEDVP